MAIIKVCNVNLGHNKGYCHTFCLQKFLMTDLGLTNPDGSEDLVEFNRNERNYKVISRVAQAGHKKYTYLLNR